MNPLVSVICISYNHAPYIKEALNSVFNQVHTEIEVIILDDGSSDKSREEIQKYIEEKSEVVFIPNTKNEGYTRTFNKGLALAKGKYVVDFALDDVMLPNFLSESVKRLEILGEEYGVSFSNADYINSECKVIGNHNKTLFDKKLIQEIPQGDIFEMVLKRYFICTPAMVIRKSVFDRMGGYDEGLSYEDFDFWLRSSRHYKYTFIDEVLMQKRKLKSSMSMARYKHRENEHMLSVLAVCRKAFSLCKSKSELDSLYERLSYEHRQCIRYQVFDLADQYIVLVKNIGRSVLKLQLVGLLIRLGFDKGRV
ncbi:glycosyltransferase [Roseivirga sp.]|uniref:glycosyltransferase n=1 Tax=Roseivirga sp. TaxID=1964215 RepID=UPI002B27B9FB|nr:glycosyltransferase [Roseivirga sp.]